MPAYRVAREGWIDNVYRKVGEKVEMTEGQARYYVAGGDLEKADEKATERRAEAVAAQDPPRRRRVSSKDDPETTTDGGA